MTNPGEYNDAEYAKQARFYVWRATRNVFPRGITPTDVDAFVEMNGCFWFFEGKTHGTAIPEGQRKGLFRLVEALGSRAVLVVGEHPPMDEINIYSSLTRVRFGYSERGTFTQSPLSLNGQGCLWALTEMFVKDATELGHLEPETWAARFEHDARSFTTPDPLDELLPEIEGDAA